MEYISRLQEQLHAKPTPTPHSDGGPQVKVDQRHDNTHDNPTAQGDDPELQSVTMVRAIF